MQMILTLSLNFFPNSTDFLDFTLKVGILLNKETIDVVQFGLQRYLQIVNYVFDLFFEV